MADLLATRRSALDWARHERTIRQLYMEDWMSLSAVREKMADEFGFHASKSQYETQLKKWGLSKNHKSAEWKVIAQILQHRQFVGKKTAVFSNGLLIPDAKVQREISRHGSLAIRKSKNQEHNSPIPPIPPRFSLRTPPLERAGTVESNNLPTMLLLRTLGDYYSSPELHRLPSARLAYVDPRALSQTGHFTRELQIPSEIVPFSAPPNSDLVRGAPLRISERHLQAILPPALNTLSLIRPSEGASMAIEGAPFLSTPYAKMLLFGIANNFAGMGDLSYSEVWTFLRSQAGTEIVNLLRRLPPHSPTGRAITERLFQGAIEAGDAAAVQAFLESPEIRIDPNEVVCQSHHRGRETALELAASRAHFEVAEILLQHRADANKHIEFCSAQSPGTRYTAGPLARLLRWGMRYSPGRYTSQLRVINIMEVSRLVDLLLCHGATVDASIVEMALNCFPVVVGIAKQLILAASDDDHLECAKSSLFHRIISLHMDTETMIGICRAIFLNRPVLEILRARQPIIRSRGRHFRPEYAPDISFLDLAVKQADVNFFKTLLVEYDFPITEITLFCAVYWGRIELVQLLLERGALADADPITVLHRRGPTGRESTPLSEALRYRRVEIVELLEQHGAFHQIKGTTRYRAALEAAFYAADFSMANRLLDLHGPYTPQTLQYGMVVAIRLNQDELALKLLELGAVPSTKIGLYALSLAMQKRKSGLVRALLDSPDTDLSEEDYLGSLRPPLFQAIKDGNVSLITELILAGAPLNVHANSTTPLIMAVRANDRRLVEILLRFGASINFSTVDNGSSNDSRISFGGSSHSSTSMGSQSKSHCHKDNSRQNRTHVDSGENGDDRTENESSLSDDDDINSESEDYSDLDESEADFGGMNIDIHNSDIDSSDDTSSDENSLGSSESYDHDPSVLTPLIAGVMNEDINMISFLLSNGADPSDSGALEQAVKMRNLEITNILLEKFRESYPRGNADYGLEALRIAIHRRNIDLIAKLLTDGVGIPLISALDNSENRRKTLLVEVLEEGSRMEPAILRMMLDAMIKKRSLASLNAVVRHERRIFLSSDPKFDAETPLLVAIRSDNFDGLRLLVEMGADVNRPTILGVRRTPLQKAAEMGNSRIAEYLINRGADINAPAAGKGGATALQFACIHGYAGIVDLLLRNDADLDAAPAKFEGRTALEGAAEHGRLDTVAMLLSAGVKIDGNYRPQFQRAIKRAQEAGHLAVADYLKSHDLELGQECDMRHPNEDRDYSGMSESGFGEEFIHWGD